MYPDDKIIKAIIEGNLDAAWEWADRCYFSVKVLIFLANTCRFELLYRYYQLVIDRDFNCRSSFDIRFNLSNFILVNVVIEGRVDVIDYLFGQKEMDPNLPLGTSLITPLMQACIRGKRDIVERLLSCDADVEQKDKYGCNSFFYAVESSDVNIFRRLFLQIGKIDYVNDLGRNLLHHMCEHSPENTEIFDEIFNFNVLDVNAQTGWGGSTLLHLILYREINPVSEYRILKLLDHPDIDLTIKNWDGVTAWDICQRKAGIPESIRQAFRKALKLDEA